MEEAGAQSQRGRERRDVMEVMLYTRGGKREPTRGRLLADSLGHEILACPEQREVQQSALWLLYCAPFLDFCSPSHLVTPQHTRAPLLSSLLSSSQSSLQFLFAFTS